MLKLELLRLAPFRAAIACAASEAGFSPYILASIALRETEATWGAPYKPKGSPFGWGDGGNGYGLFQIDKRYHKAFIESSVAKTVEGQANYAAGLLSQYRNILKQALPNLSNSKLTMAAICAFNGGPGAVARAIKKGLNPNAATTNGDYGEWVNGKAADLMVAAPDFFDLDSDLDIV